MVFKPVKRSSQAWSDPEALFRDLKSRKVEGLLSHQGQTIQSYMQSGTNKPDVAIQLPTGSGKTLVGLLIAEWRRSQMKERAVFLCPTNQLVHQVAGQAKDKFGLNVAAFTGKKKEYDAKLSGDYKAGDVVAVTSYSALFNARPFFEDPGLIVLDDAHTSAEYISAPWSVRIVRNDSPALADAIAAIFASELDPIAHARLRGEWHDAYERSQVEKVPTPSLSAKSTELRAVIDLHAENNSAIRFPWNFIRDHLDACHMYFSTREILVRPIIPPTWAHKAFEGANQRIYMSATFGESGDLERISGRSAIHRLKMPESYDLQGVGRRFFLFPEWSIDESQVDSLLEGLIKNSGRALYIVPDEMRATARRDWVENTVGHEAFDANDLETNKSAFTSTPNAVAVIANRYDGIDLAGDECRLLIVQDMPQAMNLQEGFLVASMGANALLNERISNRMVQAFGRCTRSDLDYALVVVLGSELGGRILRRETRAVLNPELQAELEFGMEQSRDTTVPELLLNASSFWKQNDDWRNANSEILSLRGSMTRTVPEWSSELGSSAGSEVKYVQAMWRSEYETALGHCRDVLAQLNHSDLRGYRALWQYLGGCAAYYAYTAGTSGAGPIAAEYFRQAGKSAAGVRWLVSLGKQHGKQEAIDAADQNRRQIQVDRIEVAFEALGTTHNRRYVAEEKLILEGLASDDGKTFERAQEKLGHLLGFDAGNRESNGAPDPWWMVDQDLCFVFEDYSESTNNSALNVSKARQAALHPKWVKGMLPVSEHATVIPILLAANVTVSKEVALLLEGVYHWPTDEFVLWAKNGLETLRELRNSYPGPRDLIWQAEALDRLRASMLDPESIRQIVISRPATALRVAEGFNRRDNGHSKL